MNRPAEYNDAAWPHEPAEVLTNEERYALYEEVGFALGQRAEIQGWTRTQRAEERVTLRGLLGIEADDDPAHDAFDAGYDAGRKAAQAPQEDDHAG